MAAKSMYEALRFKYQNTPVTVVAQKALGEFSIHDQTFGPFQKDREFEIPRWVAAVLRAEGAVRQTEAGVDLPDLQKALWRETGEPPLQQLVPNFYFQVKERLRQLQQANLKSPNDVRVAAQNKMEQLLKDLLANRLLKLMKISLREDRLRETKRKMTDEEQWLLDRLIDLLRTWQNHILEMEPDG